MVLEERARAKINLTLHVAGRRGDGYHDLESLVAFADCADRLSFTPGSALALDVGGPLAGACGATGDNLVMKAAQELSARVPDLTLGAFHLTKHLPVAAGIGGGSADAAATLRLLARANHLAPDDARLHAAAQATGADVPVCLASRAAIMRGIGDRLAPVALRAIPCVLVNPGVSVMTRDVFAALGLGVGKQRPAEAHALGALAMRASDMPLADLIALLAHYTNDLEAPAIRVAPAIGHVLKVLEHARGCGLARMSGSGATCFGLFAEEDDAAHAAHEIREAHPDWWIWGGVVG